MCLIGLGVFLACPRVRCYCLVNCMVLSLQKCRTVQANIQPKIFEQIPECVFHRPPESPDRAALRGQTQGMLRAHVQRRRQAGGPVFRNLYGVQARSTGGSGLLVRH